MIKRHLITVFLVLVLTTACSSQQVPTEEPFTEPAAVVVPAEATQEETLPPVETTAPNCLGDEVSPIGQSIADDYDAVSYDQVITWFCNGAEFEDILVALETETQTNTSVDEILQMLADGFTWEEIWLITGLVE